MKRRDFVLGSARALGAAALGIRRELGGRPAHIDAVRDERARGTGTDRRDLYARERAGVELLRVQAARERADSVRRGDENIRPELNKLGQAEN